MPPLPLHHHEGYLPPPCQIRSPGPQSPAYFRRKMPVLKTKKRGGGTPSPHGSHPPDPRPAFLMAGVPPYPTPRGEGGLPLPGSKPFTCGSRGTFVGSGFFRSARVGGGGIRSYGGWGYPPPALFGRGVPPPSPESAAGIPSLCLHTGKSLLPAPVPAHRHYGRPICFHSYLTVY